MFRTPRVTGLLNRAVVGGAGGFNARNNISRWHIRNKKKGLNALADTDLTRSGSGDIPTINLILHAAQTPFCSPARSRPFYLFIYFIFFPPDPILLFFNRRPSFVLLPARDIYSIAVGRR